MTASHPKEPACRRGGTLPTATMGPRITSPTSITQERTELGPIMRVDREAHMVAVVKMSAVPIPPRTAVTSYQPFATPPPLHLADSPSIAGRGPSPGRGP